jgi:hypothetical protein
MDSLAAVAAHKAVHDAELQAYGLVEQEKINWFDTTSSTTAPSARYSTKNPPKPTPTSKQSTAEKPRPKSKHDPKGSPWGRNGRGAEKPGSVGMPRPDTI